MFAAYPIAALLAASLSVVELVSALKTRPTFREWAWAWWSVRVVLEAGAGFVAAVLLINVAHVHWPAALVGVAAGASTSAILRQRFTTVGDKNTPLGVALAYDYFREFFDEQIEKCGSENDSKWINEEVIPTLIEVGVTSSHIGKRLADFVAGLGHMDEAQLLDEQAAIGKIVNDPGPNEAERIESLVKVGLRLKAFRTIGNLHKSARKSLPKPD